MKTIIKNYFHNIFHTPAVAILNIIGLAIGFTAFILIMQEVYYEFSFDKFHPQSACTFQVEKKRGEKYMPFKVHAQKAKEIDSLCPRIKYSFLMGSPNQYRVILSDATNERSLFQVEITPITYTSDAISFEMAEGSREAMESPTTVIIPQKTARQMFGRNSAIGKTLDVIDEYNRTQLMQIVGVYKDFPSNTIFRNCIYSGWDEKNGGILFLTLDAPQAKEEITKAIGAISFYKNEIPEFRLTAIPDIYYSQDTLDFTSGRPTGNKSTTYIFIAIAALIVTIAAINFINFTIAQIPARIKSINTQKVLGRTLFSLRLMVVSEAVFTVLFAFLLAVGLTYCIYLTGSEITYLNHSTLITNTIDFYFLIGSVAIVLGAISGIYPAFYATSFPIALVIKGSFTLSTKGKNLRHLLIGGQFTISMVLIIVSVFMNRQYQLVKTKDMGFAKEQMITVPLSLPLFQKRDALAENLKQHPGIKEMTTTTTPLLASPSRYNAGDFQINYIAANSSFIPVMEIEIKEGSDFTPLDDAKETFTVALLNETAQKELNVQVGDILADKIKVIGIIQDFNSESLHHNIKPLAVFNLGKANEGSSPYMYVKTYTSDYPSVIKHIRKSTREIDPNSLCEISFLDKEIEQIYQKEIRQTSLITFFSSTAILLSLIGIFGLTLFETGCRKKEIGIRKVMGATVTEVLAMFNGSFVKIILICFTISTPVAYYVTTQWLSDFAYKTPLSIWVFAGALFAVLSVTALTVTLQSYRAATANPVDSIKTE